MSKVRRHIGDVVFVIVVLVVVGLMIWQTVISVQTTNALNRENAQVCVQVVQLVHANNARIREHPNLFRGWPLMTIPSSCGG